MDPWSGKCRHLCCKKKKKKNTVLLLSSYTYKETEAQRGKELVKVTRPENSRASMNPDLPKTKVDAVNCFAYLHPTLWGQGRSWNQGGRGLQTD